MGDCHLARGPWGTNKKRNDLREVSVLSVGGTGGENRWSRSGEL